jgi:hypothetical protein
MGLFSSGSEPSFDEIPLTEGQKQAEQTLLALQGSTIDTPTQGTAGLSQLEQQGLQQFGGLAGLDTAGVAQSALGNLQQTLSGGFDPRTSDFFQGFRQEAQRLKGEGISDALRRSQRLTGAPAGRAQRAAGEVAGRADESILQTLGGLFNQERGRQFGAIGMGLNAPGQIGSQLLGAGALPRGIEQQILNAQFNQRNQGISNQFQQAGIANSLLNQTRFSFTPGTEGSSLFQDIAGVAGIATGLGGLGAVAGGLGAAAGGIGGFLGGAGQMAGNAFGGITSGIGSFLSGGGGLAGGSTSLFDMNAGMPGMGGPPAFGSSFDPNFQQFA